MAGVDLYGTDAGRIRNQYKTSLGRDASDDEVTGWLSGAYHGGGSVDAYLAAIAGSGEADAYKQPSNPSWPDDTVIGQNPNVNTTMPIAPQGGSDQVGNWYQEFLGRQASDDEISQWLSGAFGWGNAQNLSGIRSGIMGSNEAQNYRPPPASTGPSAPPGAPLSFPNNDPYAWFMSLTNGKPPTPETLESLAPELLKYGIRIGSKGTRGWSDTIIMPDGTMYDVIEAAGIGTGKRWQFSQNGGPGYTGGNGLGNTNYPGGQYSDAYTGLLEQMLKSRMGFLGQGVNDPYAAMYQDALKQRASQLGGANAQVDQVMKYLQERFTDLKGPGYTGAENEVLRTQALDPMEQDRNAARQRVIERLSARGLTPDSGIFQQALLEVDNAFDAMRGETQGALASNELARREDRAQRAQVIGGQLVDIPEARSREQLDVFSALEMLSKTMRNEEDARARESLGYAGVLSDLGPQRLQLALQAMGAGGSPSSLGQSLFGIANLNQNAAMLNQRNSGSLWSGLGSVAAILANAGR